MVDVAAEHETLAVVVAAMLWAAAGNLEDLIGKEARLQAGGYLIDLETRVSRVHSAWKSSDGESFENEIENVPLGRQRRVNRELQAFL